MQANGMIFWDWNGTLMDDLDFTHGCLNWMLETHGYPQRYDLAAYREIFGFPIEEYYIRAGFDFARHPYPELAECFMAHYNAGVDACPPSAHAAETLAELSRRGWRQSVLSASRRDYLIEQVAARGLQGNFYRVARPCRHLWRQQGAGGPELACPKRHRPCRLRNGRRYAARRRGCRCTGHRVCALHRRASVPQTAGSGMPPRHRRSGPAAAAAGNLIMYI